MWVFILCLCGIHALYSPFINLTTAANNTAIPNKTPRVMSHSIFSLPDFCQRSPSVLPLFLTNYKIIGWKPI